MTRDELQKKVAVLVDDVIDEYCGPADDVAIQILATIGTAEALRALCPFELTIAPREATDAMTYACRGMGLDNPFEAARIYARMIAAAEAADDQR